MKRNDIIYLLFLFVPIDLMAQAEIGSSHLPDKVMDVIPTDMNNHFLMDSLRFQTDVMQPQLSIPKEPQVVSYTHQIKQGGTGLNLWKGASLGFYGSTSQMPGLMNTETGMMMLNQYTGRWHFTVSAQANKYWMPWQRTLATQYGFGGMVGYHLSEAVSLHAFGYYYANQMQVGPAMSPYVNNTTYGGYADIRFNKTFGTHVGVRRYVNPMNGKWTTEPIVNPYIKIGDSKLEFPLGGLLKALVWGDRDNPMRYQPRPQTPNQPVRRIRR
ncbi:MAG: hypothetical protein IJ633_05605 [Prevotella sp.]|nr:hypothetical protein [Prevotella sp.]